jgi:hypothetical protein
MKESIDSLATKFNALHIEVVDLGNKLAGNKPVIQKVLDKLAAMETRQARSDKNIVAIMSGTKDTSTRLHRLENPLHPQSIQFPPPPPPVWSNPFDLNLAPMEAAHPSASTSERLRRHRQQNDHRDVGGGILGSHPPLPVTGMSQSPLPRTQDLMPSYQQHTTQHSHKPKMNFPTFDGTNPRLWKDKCESYFEIFGVSEALKPRFAALNFSGVAETWLQTVESRGRITSWEALHQAICAHFDRDQYQLHMKHLDNLRQTSSVSDYYAKFEELAHSILLYNPTYDDTFLVVRFLNGLKEEIRAPIALHRPKDVDTASALALLQEEELEARRRHSSGRSEIKDFGKLNSKVFSAGDKSKAATKREEVKASLVDDKWAALKSFRKANGVCFTCGEKWGKGHKCPTHVSINVIQEFMELLDSDSEGNSSESDSVGDDLCALTTNPTQESHQLCQSPKKRKTMRVRGFIWKQELLILLDSGSARTFITPEVSNSISQSIQSCPSLQFSTADGSPMVSDSMIPQLQWHIQGHTFTYDTRVIPLKNYDMILGADWLADHGPMWIHWRKQKLRVPHKGRRILLQGIQDDVTKCSRVSAHKLKGLLKRKAVVQCVELISVVPTKFEDICALSSGNSNSTPVNNDSLGSDIPQEVKVVVHQFSELFHEPSLYLLQENLITEFL